MLNVLLVAGVTVVPLPEPDGVHEDAAISSPAAIVAIRFIDFGFIL